MDSTTPLPRRLLTALWWSVTAPLTVVGVACAFLQIGDGAALVLAGLASTVTAFAMWQLHGQTPATRPATSIVATGLLGGIGMLGLIGVVGSFGGAGLGICALVAATGGLLLRRTRPSRAATPEEGTPEEGGHRTDPSVGPALETVAEVQLPTISSLHALSTADVCWAWRLSYPQVRQPGCPGYQLDHLARFRRACLEELERRDPVAFGRWLPTARAAGDPARVFCRQSQRR